MKIFSYRRQHACRCIIRWPITCADAKPSSLRRRDNTPSKYPLTYRKFLVYMTYTDLTFKPNIQPNTFEGIGRDRLAALLTRLIYTGLRRRRPRRPLKLHPVQKATEGPPHATGYGAVSQGRNKTQAAGRGTDPAAIGAMIWGHWSE